MPGGSIEIFTSSAAGDRPCRYDAPVTETGLQNEKIAKALADPQRFALLEVICRAGEGEIPCKELVPMFSVCQATISHHLKELMAAELISGRREGQQLMLSPKPEAMRQYLQSLQERLGIEA